MRNYSLFLLLVIIIGCKNKIETEKILDFGAFQMTVPNDWSKFKQKGIDSYVGGITNGRDSLTFDYGWYSYSLNNEKRNKQLFAVDTINGKIALITKPKQNKDGTIGIYFENAHKKNRFNLIGENITNEKLVLKIFKSIKFKSSDTTLNSKKIDFSVKITPYSGRDIFYIHCAACHFKNKSAVGPALSSINKSGFRKWILDSTDIEKLDTTKFGIIFHRKTFGKSLTETDIIKLIEYSKSD